MNQSIIERKRRWAEKMSGKLVAGPPSTERLPPGQHLVAGFPVLDLGVQPILSLAEWRLEVTGEVENPITFDWQMLESLPRFESISDFHCVTTWTKFDCRWSGVAFFSLVDLVRPRPDVRFLYVTAYDGYSTNLPVGNCLDDDVLIATHFDGRPLSTEHGAPCRMIVPKLYGWKGAKFIRRIEFRLDDKRGFWETRGYSELGDPWTEDRFASRRRK